ncbi:MAG TPA: M36 family metallopeptidase, partial [Kofleriaceae bacterium]|nr:M36 family metallopeptidase [Kofleriaceae bacterium]
GSLDSTLIAHEFGHYIHHRLSFCENKMCRAMSEGWGDFSALLLLARPGDNLAGAFPFSVYTTQGFSSDPAYFGIRRAPYSVNPNINSLSFRHMRDGEPTPTNHPFNPSNTNSEVHNAGEVWAEVLWEGYVALQKAGTSFDEVRAKMAQYVVAGLLLAPSEASPLETRNALLAAVLAAGNQADHDALIAAFARRGFGSCAVAPAPDSPNFAGIVESHEVAGNPGITAFALEDSCDHDGVLDSGETATLKITVTNNGHAPLTDLQLAVTSSLPGVTIMTPPTTLARLDQFATTDLEVQVALDGATAPVAGDLALTIAATGGCTPTLTIPVAFRLNIDDRAAASATDGFDAETSVWSPWTSVWRHVRESALDGAWHGDDLAGATDTFLTSPLLHVSDSEPLVITFQHAFSFEESDGEYYDGGVIEYSTDDGDTWLDVATLASPGYTHAIASGTGNALADRMAYAGTNPAWPGADTVKLDFGTALAGQAFRLRFRLATDAGTGAPGWTIDDVAFSGIVGTPFPVQQVDDGVCDGDDPGGDDLIMSGGGGCCDAGPLRGETAGLALGVLAFVIRRRRRR